MHNRIVILDYSSDWYLDKRYVHPRSKPGPLSREEVVQFYGKLDADGIELLHAYWHDCSPAYLKQLTAAAGLQISSYIFPADLAQAPAGRRQAVDHTLAMLDRTAELGAPLAMIHPALFKPELPLQQQRAWLIEGLAECAERARSLGITLAAENIDDPAIRPFMGRGADCLDICAAVDSPSFRLIYDAGAALFVEEEPFETLQVMAPYMVHVHVKNNRPLAPGEVVERYRDSVGGKSYTGTLLDEGVVDLPAILAELKRLGYAGSVCIEYQGEADPRIALKHNVAYLRQLLAD